MFADRMSLTKTPVSLFIWVESKPRPKRGDRGMYVHGIKRLFPFEEYVVEQIKCAENLAEVRLRRDKRYKLTCPKCGATMTKNRTAYQTARDIPICQAKGVILIYEAVQGRCRECNSYSTIHPEGIDPHAKATWRMMLFTAHLCRFTPLKRVQEIIPVSKATANRWDKKVLKQELPDPDYDDLKILLVDEKSIWSHHGYITIVLNGENGELLHMAKGKKKAAFTSFFDKLSEKQKTSIQAVAMDRGGAYKAAAEQEIPHADIVYDKFHIIKNYLSDVVDAVRRSVKRGAIGKMKDLIKGQRHNLYRNPENRSDSQKEDLQAVLDAYEELSCVNTLKEELRRLWDYTYGAWARRHLNKWIGWAREAEEIAPLHRFADSLEKSKEYILNFFNYRITNGPLEGFNNVVSRIIHRACGYSDMDYLFLKLRQESLDFCLQT